MASDLGRVRFRAPPCDVAAAAAAAAAEEEVAEEEEEEEEEEEVAAAAAPTSAAVGGLSLKIRSTKRTRHSVTTACTPTPWKKKAKKQKTKQNQHGNKKNSNNEIAIATKLQMKEYRNDEFSKFLADCYDVANKEETPSAKRRKPA